MRLRARTFVRVRALRAQGVGREEPEDPWRCGSWSLSLVLLTWRSPSTAGTKPGTHPLGFGQARQSQYMFVSPDKTYLTVKTMALVKKKMKVSEIHEEHLNLRNSTPQI